MRQDVLVMARLVGPVWTIACVILGNIAGESVWGKIVSLALDIDVQSTSRSVRVMQFCVDVACRGDVVCFCLRGGLVQLSPQRVPICSDSLCFSNLDLVLGLRVVLSLRLVLGLRIVLRLFIFLCLHVVSLSVSFLCLRVDYDGVLCVCVCVCMCMFMFEYFL